MTFLFKRKSGIWYYRKTVVLPSGERKQIRQSLRTYNPKLAQYLALKLYFNIGPDRDVVAVVSNQQTGELLAPITRLKSQQLQLNTAITQFLAEKARTGLWCPKEYRRGEVMLEALGKLLGGVEVRAITHLEERRVICLAFGMDEFLAKSISGGLRSRGYGIGFGWEQYEALAKLAGDIEGHMVISINDHPDIRALFGHLNCREVDYGYTVGGGGQSSGCIELIYTSPRCEIAPRSNSQRLLFPER